MKCSPMYPYGLYICMNICMMFHGTNRQASDNLKEARQNRALAQRQVHGPNSFKQQVGEQGWGVGPWGPAGDGMVPGVLAWRG